MIRGAEHQALCHILDVMSWLIELRVVVMLCVQRHEAETLPIPVTDGTLRLNSIIVAVLV